MKHLLDAGMEEAILVLMDTMSQRLLKRSWSIFKESILDEDMLVSRVNDKNHLPGAIGQLSVKHEAAGKERVFALVDSWTQSVLSPLHQYLFKFLKSLPNDGTFDHYASVKRCISKVKLSGCSYGYDLSAATDRLPVDVQVAVLSALIGPGFSAAWKHLLVNRDYHLSYREGDIPVSISLRYKVGQPMGALSS
jgi:hypothetical protein